MITDKGTLIKIMADDASKDLVFRRGSSTWNILPKVTVAKANAIARKHGFGRCTSIVWGQKNQIVKAWHWGYVTKGGNPITHPSSYSKRGWSNMKYVPAACQVELDSSKSALI